MRTLGITCGASGNSLRTSDPLQSRLEEKEERERLAKIFNQGLDKVVGYVLPIQRRYGAGSYWTSGPWFLRSEHLFLIPGDSPIGLRLPLDSVPWVSKVDYSYIQSPDLFRSFHPCQAPKNCGRVGAGENVPSKPS